MTNGAPITGVLGAEDIIRQGTTGALQVLGQGVGQARGDIQAGQAGLGQQAALAGLRGAGAQEAAFGQFQASPGQQFLQEQAERAVTRQAAATGGLGGGNVLQELQRQAVGLAQQDFENQFQRGQQVIGSQQLGAQNLANLSAQGGQLGADLVSGATSQLGEQRFAAGQQLSTQAQQQANNLANLQSQLGVGVADITGQGAANVGNLVSAAGAGTANLQQQLATLLANIQTGGASQSAQLDLAAGQFDVAGTQAQNAAVQQAIAQLIQTQQQQQQA